MSRWIQPSAENPAFEWLAFFLFLLLLSVCLLGVVVKHRHHRHHHASSLPPVRPVPRELPPKREPNPPPAT
jgi:hypothetical protein